MISKIKKSLAVLVAVACPSLAIDPNQPVCRLVGADIVQHADTMPTKFGTTVNYEKATEIRWNKDGWVQTELVDNTVYTTNPIPPQIQQVAVNYKEVLEDYFGAGAVTNPAIDRTFVTITLSLDTNVSASVAVRLRAWYEILYGYWSPADGELDDFPWDQTEYVTTSGGVSPEPYLYVTPIPDFSDTPAGTPITTTFNLVNARSDQAITGTMSIPAGPFTITSPSSFTLAPSDIEVVTLTFNSLSSGEFSDEITIASDKGTYTNALKAVALE